jgi:hypothetical protein
MADTITFRRICIFCGLNHVFIVDADKYYRWRSGGYIQDVFPEIDKDVREKMVSGSCKECLEKALGSEED